MDFTKPSGIGNLLDRTAAVTHRHLAARRPGFAIRRDTRQRSIFVQYFETVHVADLATKFRHLLSFLTNLTRDRCVALPCRIEPNCEGVVRNNPMSCQNLSSLERTQIAPFT